MKAIADGFVGTSLVAGRASAPATVLDEPLSFWGGFDSTAGTIVEDSHAQCGASLAARVLIMAKAKGSSSSSSVLAEAIRNGTGPSAIVMRERDLIVALGCIVADELYGKAVPVAVVDDAAWQALSALSRDAEVSLCVHCQSDGTARITIS